MAIYIILGTKAQLIKMAPIMVELQTRGIPYKFIHTGQHRETMDDLIANFGIKNPDVYLYRGKDITSIAQVIPWMIRIIHQSTTKKSSLFMSPGVVLVHGDTFSTILGALIGKFNKLRVAHVESGLRSHKLFDPFPEEIVRILTSSMSDIYFCPGKWAKDNLKNYRGEKYDCKMNTMIDAVKLASKANVSAPIPRERFVICSIHRFENIFNRKSLERICSIVERISHKFKVVFILHPPTSRQLQKYGLYDRLNKNKNIELRPRYDFFTFNALLRNSSFVVTDGGSNQEECYYLNKPCLILRNSTERQEGLKENAVLSKFQNEIIEDFLRNYKSFRVKHNTQRHQPSRLIVNAVKRYQ
jgi:UDP-N-acetylglucosamine 2-epimerase (non-hydrolysing)